jgi:hypothetical protein
VVGFTDLPGSQPAPEPAEIAAGNSKIPDDSDLRRRLSLCDDDRPGPEETLPMWTPSSLSMRPVRRIAAWRLCIAAVVLAFLPRAATAEVVFFAAPTDTIQVEGNSVATSELTIEARVRRLSCGPVSGRLYSEQADALEDKALYASESTISGGAWTGVGYTGLQADAQLIAGRWYHLAFVRDGDEERLYLDGELQAQRTWAPSIRNAANSERTLGAFQYTGGGPFAQAVGCQIDFVRVSDSVRYVGPTFSPPSEADLAADGNTQLLFFFDEPSGSAVIEDASAGNHDGVVGVGTFATATSPTLGAEALCPADIDGSCEVGFADLTQLLGTWGPCDSDCPTDLDGSGGVGFGDLTELLGTWGPCFS